MSNSVSKPAWQDGTLLHPNHFQQYSRYLEYLIKQRSSIPAEMGYGLKTLNVNQEALLEGKFEILSASGHFKNGEYFNTETISIIKNRIDLTKKTENCILYLILTSTSDVGIEKTYDVFLPHKEKIEIATEKQVLLLADSPGKNSETQSLAIAEIVIDEVGSPTYSSTYIPSALRTSSIKNCKALLKKISTALLSLSIGIKNTIEYKEGSAASVYKLGEIIRLRQTLKEQVEEGSAHPYSIFSLILTGVSSTYYLQHDQLMPSLTYKHHKLRETFQQLLVLIQGLTKDQESKNQHQLILTKIKPGHWLIDKVNMEAFTNMRLYVKRKKKEEPISHILKVATPLEMPELIHYALPGIPLLEDKESKHSDWEIYTLDTRSDFWQSIQTSQSIAMHSTTENLDIMLYGVID